MAHHDRHSRIFIVRLWTEVRPEVRDTQILRGMVRNVESGETRYFRCWQDVVAFFDKESQSESAQEPKRNPEREPESDEGEKQEVETQAPMNQTQEEPTDLGSTEPENPDTERTEPE